jgi:hypothetical protein
LLAEKGISYETKIENRDSPHFSMTLAAEWSAWLLNPFCCFILVAGAVTLLRGSHSRPPEPHSIADLRSERRVDKSFAALAACGMVALAIFLGVTTDWKVRAITADRLPAIIAQHKSARFEIFEYTDGSRKLWISDLHTPDFIAPANESTLGVLTRQDIAYQTYVAGAAGLPGPSQPISALWILALTAGAGGLCWWTAKSRPFASSRTQGTGTI